MASSPVSSLGSQSARKATPKRSPRPRKVTASGPQWPSSDSSDDDDDEEVRRLEAALAAAKAKKQREAIRAVAASRELCRELWAASSKEVRRLATLCGIRDNQKSTDYHLAELEKLVEESSLPPAPAPKSARVATATSGYDTLEAHMLSIAQLKAISGCANITPGAARGSFGGTIPTSQERSLPTDVLTKVLEFLPLDDAAAAKQLSSLTASAARQALTRGRWRPFKTFCQDGDGQGRRMIGHLSYTDQDFALFDEVWALEPGAVMKELTLWPPMHPMGRNSEEIEGALRYLDLVEPEPTSGFGRIVAAFAASRGLVTPPISGDADWGVGGWARGIINQWGNRVRGKHPLHAGLASGSIDLGLSAWETPTDGAKFILRQLHNFGFWSYAEFMGRVPDWLDRRKAEIFVEAYEEIAEELWDIQEREAYIRQMRAEYLGVPLSAVRAEIMGIPLSDAESEDDGSDSEEEESSDHEECVIM